jgi:hypothetical protein
MKYTFLILHFYGLREADCPHIFAQRWLLSLNLA